jgi:hypothetical protein
MAQEQRIVARHVGAPTLGAVGLGAISSSTGSILIDAALGAGIGYFISPVDEEERYAIGGALASGLGGVLGIALLVGWRYWRK